MQPTFNKNDCSRLVLAIPKQTLGVEGSCILCRNKVTTFDYSEEDDVSEKVKKSDELLYMLLGGI